MEKNEFEININYCKAKYFLCYVVAVLGIVILYYFYNYRLDLLWNKGGYWYPFIFITPGLLLALGKIFDTLSFYNLDIVNRIFRNIGDASWNIFLIHVLMFDTVCQVYIKMTDKKWIMMGFLCIIGGIIINNIEKTIKLKLLGKV